MIAQTNRAPRRRNAVKNVFAAALLIAACVTVLTPQSTVAESPRPEHPRIGLSFTELPTSIQELRFAFECADNLEIEMRWIAQTVTGVTPEFEIAKARMVTRGPLNMARLSRPTNGWPVGLYRLELRHRGKVFHTQRYAIESPETLNGG